MSTVRLIDPEFAALIPPLSDEELAGLEASLLAEGCRDPLVLWSGILLDGHHRLPLCEKHGIPYQTTTVDLADRPAAKVWMCRNQLNRRNLPKYEWGLLGRIIRDNTPKRSGQRTDLTSDGETPEVGRSAAAAKAVGIDRQTLGRVDWLEEHADEETKAKLRRDELPIGPTYQKLRLRELAPAVEVDAGAPLPELGTFAIELGDSLYRYLAHGDPRADKLELVLQADADLTLSARHDLYYSLAAVAERVTAAMDTLRASGPVDADPVALTEVTSDD